MPKEVVVEPKKLTLDGTSVVGGRSAFRFLAALLDEVGLKLWHAPEGFWAIRVKRQAPAVEETRRRPAGARSFLMARVSEGELEGLKREVSVARLAEARGVRLLG